VGSDAPRHPSYHSRGYWTDWVVPPNLIVSMVSEPASTSDPVGRPLSGRSHHVIVSLKLEGERSIGWKSTSSTS